MRFLDRLTISLFTGRGMWAVFALIFAFWIAALFVAVHFIVKFW